MDRIKLSADFWLHEFACRCAANGHYAREPTVYCGGLAIVQPELVMMLQKLRDHFGRRIDVTSGYRCPPYNRRSKGKGGIGGASQSWHMLGHAADIRVDGIDPIEVARVADWLAFRGIDVYVGDNFTHVDVRYAEPWRGAEFRRLIG